MKKKTNAIKHPENSDQESKSVLITFGRSFMALELARLMHAVGHRVVVVDSQLFPVSRFSNAVDKFVQVPPPAFKPREYAAELVRIVIAEKIDTVIPMHEDTDVLAALRDEFPSWCSLLLSDFETEKNLHNKADFQRLLGELGFPALRYASLSTQQEADECDLGVPIAVKPTYSRGSQKVRKVAAGESLGELEFEDGNPWLAQEWMSGNQYCTYSVCHNGKVYANAIYPVTYAIDGSSCLVFEEVRHPGIFAWIEKFIQEINFTGQIGFDIIEAADGTLYSIECNPRSTSGVMLFDVDDRVDRAFFGTNESVITPKVGRRKMIGPGMAMYGWKATSKPDNRFGQFWKDFRRTDDVILRRTDLKPVFSEPLAYFSIFRAAARYRVGIAEAYLHDHGWDGQDF